MGRTTPWSRSVRRPRILHVLCPLTVLLVTATGALAHDSLMYVGTYTDRGSEGIYAYRFDPDTGETSPIGLVAEPDNPSSLAVDPGDGTLESLEWVSSGGKTPRNFVIDPTGTWLIAANQDSNTIDLFRIDPKSGRLSPTDRTLSVASPVCVRVVSFE